MHILEESTGNILSGWFWGGIGADEDLLVAATLELAGDLLDGAGTMIRDGVENETISH